MIDGSMGLGLYQSSLLSESTLKQDMLSSERERERERLSDSRQVDTLPTCQ